MKAPRVAHLVIALDHGGLERCALLWTQGRNRRLTDSTRVFCLDHAGTLATRLPSGTVTAVGANRTRFPWDRQAVVKLRQLITDQAIDMIHSHNTAARFYATLAVRHTHIKHLYTDHGTNLHLNGWRDRLRLWFMAAHTDCIVAVSQPAACALAEARPKPSDIIEVIPNGIDPTPIGDQRLRAELAIPEHDTLLGYIGRLSPEKGVDRLLKAIADCPAGYHLAIIGDGPSREALQRQATATTAAGRIHFMGIAEEARPLMPGLDLLVLPSRSEGLPLTVLEAMAEGVSVAATRTGQCPELLDHGRLGLLLPDDDTKWPTLLTAEIEAIRSGGRQITRETAHQHISDHYSLGLTLDRYEACYRKASADT